MISKSEISLFSSLKQKKFRLKEQLFVVEGRKSIDELLKSQFQVERLFTVKEDLFSEANAEIIKAKDYRRISSFKNGDGSLALVRIPYHKPNLDSDILFLDGIRDPGNLGTMMRSSDWYGLKQVLCSEDCADFYNPKTVAASMGSIFHLNYAQIESSVLKQLQNSHQIIATSLEGETEFEFDKDKPKVIVIGSESHGIRDEVIKHSHCLIRLEGKGEAESLNASVACGIILDRIFAFNR